MTTWSDAPRGAALVVSKCVILLITKSRQVFGSCLWRYVGNEIYCLRPRISSRTWMFSPRASVLSVDNQVLFLAFRSPRMSR